MHFHFVQAAESGNLEDFIRLYQGDNSRLAVQDPRGRTVSHQASLRNRVAILTYIHNQQGSEYNSAAKQKTFRVSFNWTSIAIIRRFLQNFLHLLPSKTRNTPI